MRKNDGVVRIDVPKFGEILTARPKKMSYEEYRAKRTGQNKRLKARLKGFLVYKSSEIVKVGEVDMLRKYKPCVGKHFVLKFS